MNIPLRKIPYLIITAFWLLTIAMVIERHYFPENVKFNLYGSALPKGLYEEQWMGAYLNGEKIGYSHRKLTDSKDGYKISENLRVRLRMMGVEKVIETVMDAETDRLFRTLSFIFKLKSDVPIEIKGKVEDKKLLFSIDAGGMTSTHTLFLQETPYISLSVVPHILREGLRSGNKLRIPLIDPTTLSQENVEIEVMERDPIISMGRRQDAFKIKGNFRGIETFLWLTDKGEVLREESPLGFTLVKETRENAIQPGRPSIDLIAQVAIPFNIKLPDGVDYLKVKISGVDLRGLELDGARQSLKGDILEIKKETLNLIGESNPPFPPLAKGGEGGLLDEYLKDTAFIQSKNPAIISLAKDIVGDEKDRLKMTGLIYDWVYKNIEKVPTMSLPMATEVLRTLKGDCNEHTTLFTSLARAAGIPARIAVGLMYKDGPFYYHAWPEVYINEWVAVDPTLGQFPADASHIRLLSGDIDKQLKLITVIGKLRLEGIEYR